MPSPLPTPHSHVHLRLDTEDLALLRAIYPRRVNSMIRLFIRIHCDKLRARGLTADMPGDIHPSLDIDGD